LTAPGVPDLYQGCELWSFNLVDPDNRRPVDFGLHRALLRDLTARIEGTDDQALAHLTRELAENLDDGRAKLYLIARALGLRAQHPDLFAYGDYLPLAVEGPHAERLCAFRRRHAGRSVIVLAPRLLAPLATPPADSAAGNGSAPIDPFAHPGWESTVVEIPAGGVMDQLSGGRLETDRFAGGDVLRAADILRRFPVGLLTAADT
jgi:(1->4)-alpha-D-glucan 1-alpha-D-glucosylmutase